jgi:hypothetical protein
MYPVTYIICAVRRDGRVVDCTGLENRQGFVALLGFKSLSLRHIQRKSPLFIAGFFVLAKERDLNPRVPLFEELSYPSDRSQANINRKSFCWAKERDLNPRVPLFEELSYPSDRSQANINRKSFCWAKERDLNPRVPFF